MDARLTCRVSDCVANLRVNVVHLFILKCLIFNTFGGGGGGFLGFFKKNTMVTVKYNRIDR